MWQVTSEGIAIPTGLKHPERAQIIQQVECRGETHTVAMINNQIVLPAHNIKRENAFLDMGAEMCPCMSIYSRLAQVSPHRAGPENSAFDRHCLEASVKRSGRFQAMARSTCLHKVTDNKTLSRTIELLVRYKCDYDYNVNDPIIYVSEAEPQGVGCHLINRRLEIFVCRDWLTEIYARGMAVVDSMLVLHVKRLGAGPNQEALVSLLWPEYSPRGQKEVIIKCFDNEWRLTDMTVFSGAKNLKWTQAAY